MMAGDDVAAEGVSEAGLAATCGAGADAAGTALLAAWAMGCGDCAGVAAAERSPSARAAGSVIAPAGCGGDWAGCKVALPSPEDTAENSAEALWAADRAVRGAATGTAEAGFGAASGVAAGCGEEACTTTRGAAVTGPALPCTGAGEAAVCGGTVPNNPFRARSTGVVTPGETLAATGVSSGRVLSDAGADDGRAAGSSAAASGNAVAAACPT
jgi:hypothetical protein